MQSCLVKFAIHFICDIYFFFFPSTAVSLSLSHLSLFFTFLVIRKFYLKCKKNDFFSSVVAFYLIYAKLFDICIWFNKIQTHRRKLVEKESLSRFKIRISHTVCDWKAAKLLCICHTNTINSSPVEHAYIESFWQFSVLLLLFFFLFWLTNFLLTKWHLRMCM